VVILERRADFTRRSLGRLDELRPIVPYVLTIRGFRTGSGSESQVRTISHPGPTITFLLGVNVF